MTLIPFASSHHNIFRKKTLTSNPPVFLRFSSIFMQISIQKIPQTKPTKKIQYVTAQELKQENKSVAVKYAKEVKAQKKVFISASQWEKRERRETLDVNV